MRKRLALCLAFLFTLSALSVSALTLSDTTGLFEFADDTVYVYDKDITAEELEAAFGGAEYINEDGVSAEDSDIVYMGSLKNGDTTYPVKMQKMVFEDEFETERPRGQRINEFFGTNWSRTHMESCVGGIGGHDEDDHAYVLTTTNSDGKSELGEETAVAGAVVTYEMQIYIRDSNTEAVNFMLPYLNADGAKQWTAQYKILGNGTYSVYGKEGKAAVGRWHTLVQTLNIARGKLLAYLDGELVAEQSVTNLAQAKNIKFETTYPNGASGMVAFDKQKVYIGAYYPPVVEKPESLDTSKVEFEDDTIYVYDRTLTPATLPIDAKGASVVYADANGDVSTEIINGGTLTIGSDTYVVSMTKLIRHYEFNENETLYKQGSSFDNVNPTWETGIGGKTDSALVIRADAAAIRPEQRSWDGAGEKTGKPITYELQAYLNENVGQINICVKNYSANVWSTQANLFGSGIAELGDDKSAVNINKWHTIAMTFYDDGTVEFYLDGILKSTRSLTNYTGIEDVRIVMSINADGMAAMDNFKVYYGSYSTDKKVLVSSDEYVIVDGDYVYVYKTGMKKSELLSVLSADGAIINYINANGEVAAEDEAVKNGTVTVDEDTYTVMMRKDIFSDDYNRDVASGAQPSSAQGLTHQGHVTGTENAVGGRADGDKSFVFKADNIAKTGSNSNPSLWMYPGIEDGVVTVKTSAYVSGNGMPKIAMKIVKDDGGTYWSAQNFFNANGKVTAGENYKGTTDINGWHTIATTLDFIGDKISYYLDGVLLTTEEVPTMKKLDRITLEASYSADIMNGIVAFDNFDYYCGAYDSADDLLNICPTTDHVVLSTADGYIGIDGSYSLTAFRNMFADPENVTVYDDDTMTSQENVKSFGVEGYDEYVLFASKSGDVTAGYKVCFAEESAETPEIAFADGKATASVVLTGTGSTAATFVIAEYNGNKLTNIAFASADNILKRTISAELNAVSGRTYKAFAVSSPADMRSISEAAVETAE